MITSLPKCDPRVYENHRHGSIKKHSLVNAITHDDSGSHSRITSSDLWLERFGTATKAYLYCDGLRNQKYF